MVNEASIEVTNFYDFVLDGSSLNTVSLYGSTLREEIGKIFQSAVYNISDAFQDYNTCISSGEYGTGTGTYGTGTNVALANAAAASG